MSELTESGRGFVEEISKYLLFIVYVQKEGSYLRLLLICISLKHTETRLCVLFDVFVIKIVTIWSMCTEISVVSIPFPHAKAISCRG